MTTSHFKVVLVRPNISDLDPLPPLCHLTLFQATIEFVETATTMHGFYAWEVNRAYVVLRRPVTFPSLVDASRSKSDIELFKKFVVASRGNLWNHSRVKEFYASHGLEADAVNKELTRLVIKGMMVYVDDGNDNIAYQAAGWAFQDCMPMVFDKMAEEHGHA